MISGTGGAARRARTAGGFFILVFLAFLLAPVLLRPAHGADYPRRVAVAPFAFQSEEDISRIVEVLPRLLASRLAALAGAEVVLLPPDAAPPEAAAREAGVPLLLRGTVVRIGQAYSIDVTALDLDAGKKAGSFFASAETVDGIIPGLGGLAAGMAEKLFGAAAVRAPSAPAPRAAAPPPGSADSGTPASPAPPPSPAGSIAAASSSVASPMDDWVPSSLTLLSQSGRISDAIFGIVAGDTDAEGNGEVIAYGRKTVYLYRVAGSDLLPYSRITKGLPGHILNVEAIDLDADGRKEILVTGFDGDVLRSAVFRRKGDVYEKAADRIPYYLVVLPDREGKPVVVGQQVGSDMPFYGRFVTMVWNGSRLVAGEALPADTRTLPLAAGVIGLSSAGLGDGWRLIYTDQEDRLRVLDPSGQPEYKSEKAYGMGRDLFEWGVQGPREATKPRYSLRKAARVSAGPDGRPIVLIPEVEKRFIDMSDLYKSTRLVLLRWESSDFVEKAGTSGSSHFYSGADFLSPSGLREGGKLVAAVIEKTGRLKGDRSHLALFEVR
jgi:hypothetical protein